MKIVSQRWDPAVPVDSLNLHPRNPREGNVGLIGESIDALGFYGAIIAQVSTRFILAGNHRFRAALEKEARTVPVLWADVDDDTALRIMLVDNRANDEASNNEPDLTALLREIAEQTGTLEGTGYTGDDLDELIAQATAAGPAAPAAKDEKQEAGDVVNSAGSGNNPSTCPQCGFRLP